MKREERALRLAIFRLSEAERRHSRLAGNCRRMIARLESKLADLLAGVEVQALPGMGRRLT